MTAAEFVATLNTRRVFGVFVVAFAVGLVSIVARAWVPWIPAFVVIAYGCLLLLAARTYHVQHSETTNNSPYFLGFLFFLSSLARTFAGITIEGSETQIDFVVHELGAALLSTIVGIGFRQALFAFSPQIADQDLFFRTLEEELRRSATEFRKSQTELASLLAQFVELRKTLFEDEERAAKKYVRNLERAIALFDDQISQYPTTIGSALTRCKEALETLQTKVVGFSETASRIDSSKLAGAAEQLGILQAAAQALVAELRQFTQSVITIKSETDTLPGQIREKAKLVREDVEQVDALLNEFVTLARGRIEALSR